jgi:lysozyme
MKKQVAWITICVACVSGFEGIRQYAYLDPVGIPTICFGETQGVALGQRRTLDECKSMLEESLYKANNAVDNCVHVPLSDNRRAALVSFTYNVGGTAFCQSTLVRKLNSGDPKACDELLRWTKAKGIALPGLVKRREAERTMCLSPDKNKTYYR